VQVEEIRDRRIDKKSARQLVESRAAERKGVQSRLEIAKSVKKAD
jgi:hypothetical protein